MITASYLDCEVLRSKSIGKTTDFLRHFSMFVVKGALRAHFGDNFSIRCLQSSAAFEMVLGRIGLTGTIWGGAVCFAEAFANPPHEFRFGGFWDQDHHVWFITQFTEVVDLTVSQMHMHPANTRSDALPIPPVWWDNVSKWPATMRYLPGGRLKIALPGDEAVDFERFKRIVDRTFDEITKQLDRDDIPAIDLLWGPGSFNELYEGGHPWVVDTLRYQTHGIELPTWILEREKDLYQDVVSRRRLRSK